MKKLIFILLFMFAISAYSMELADYQKLKIGDIIHVKIEWGGTVRLEGNAVVQFLTPQWECVQAASIEPSNNFYSSFHRGFITLVSESSDGNVVLLKQENAKLKATIATLLAELKRIIGMLE